MIIANTRGNGALLIIWTFSQTEGIWFLKHETFWLKKTKKKTFAPLSAQWTKQQKLAFPPQLYIRDTKAAQQQPEEEDGL